MVPGPFFAFCGIGNPGAFLMDLQSWNLAIVGKTAFADHHEYSEGEILELMDGAREAGAEALVTTEKDAQNMGDVGVLEMPVYVAVIEAELPQELAFLDAIRKRMPPEWAAG
jgi:tetraacyldisaccharide 4'-kinase